MPGRLLILIVVGQGPTVLAADAGEGCFDSFSPFILSLSLGHGPT